MSGKTDETFGHTPKTHMYSHCNMCNILIYFCNMHMKHLQHTSKTSETLETYTCNMCFQVQHLLAAWTNGSSSTRSLALARSSMPRAVGRSPDERLCRSGNRMGRRGPCARCPRGVLEKGRRRACNLRSLLLMLLLLRQRRGRRRDGESGRR